MAKQHINIGNSANDGAGDPLRTAFDKINDNFIEIYNELGGNTLSNISMTGNTILSDDTNGNITIDPNGTGTITLASAVTINGATLTMPNLTISNSGSTFTTGGTNNIHLVPGSGIVNVTGILNSNVTGDVTGNVTGNVTGDVTGDVTGNVNVISDKKLNVSQYTPATKVGHYSGITSVNTIGAADANRTANTYNGVTGTSSGSGTPGTFDIVVDVTGAAVVNVASEGYGHQIGDEITISDADLGGGGAPDLTFNVATITRNDLAGDVAFDSSYIYYCFANADGTSDAWKRVAITTW